MNLLFQILLFALLVFIKAFFLIIGLWVAYLVIKWLMPKETTVVLEKYTK